MAMGLMLLHALEEEVGFILQGQQILILSIPEEEDFNKVEQVGVEIMLMAGQAYECGGFGGGTAGDYYSSCNTFGGNGGGYSGGSGYSTTLKYYGEAGGSYNGGTNQNNLSGNSGNTGNGYIIIAWNSSVCVSSSRTSVTVIVNPPAAPTTTANPGLVCAGQVSSFVAVAPIGIIRWWNSRTGGNLIATTACGGTFIVTPAVTTIYYAENYTSCGTSTRTGDTVTIGTLSAPTAVNAIPSSINCGGGSSSWSQLTGFTLAQNIGWYDAPTGGNLIGNTISNGICLSIPFLQPNIMLNLRIFIRVHKHFCIPAPNKPLQCQQVCCQ